MLTLTMNLAIVVSGIVCLLILVSFSATAIILMHKRQAPLVSYNCILPHPHRAIRFRNPISVFVASVFILTVMVYTFQVSSLLKSGGIFMQLRQTYTTSSGANVSSRNRAGTKLMIPKIFHQTYTSAKIESAYKNYITGCLRLNPDWQYYLWRDEDILAFIKDHFPEFMPKYKHFYMNVQRADCIRYMVLHHFGGVYVDMDVECVKPFFPGLSNYTAFLDQEAREHARILYSREFTAMNSAMGSVQGHPFFRRMVRAMMEVDDRVTGAGHSTGPDLLTAELIKWWQGSGNDTEHAVSLLPPEVFSPLVDTRTHNFRMLCEKIFRASRLFKTRGDPADAKRQAIREVACRDYARNNWRRDMSNAATIGRHLFLHLGYQQRKRRLSVFDISEVKANVKFYQIHRMKP